MRMQLPCYSTETETHSSAETTATMDGDCDNGDAIIRDAANALDFRIGKSVKVWRHEEVDSLYVEEVDVGETEPRTICSSLVKYIPLHLLQVFEISLSGILTASVFSAQNGNPPHPASSEAYGEVSYWDNRYTQDSSIFDWYQKYPSIAPLIRLYVPRRHPILVVGCGNSGFSEGMVDDGFDEVVNIDISSVVIEAMQKKYLNCPQLKYLILDVRDMSAFDTMSFAAVIDKGTLDSLLCGHNSRYNAAKMLEEVWRVLKDKGVYILITYGSPSYRLSILKELTWSIKLHVIDKIQSGSSSHWSRELTSPISLDGNGDVIPETSAVGVNSDVHYIYVCIKDKSEA